MIWSLLRILAFVALTAALAYAGGLLIESDGRLQITAMGFEITLGPLQAAILGVLIVLLVWALMRLSGLVIATVRFINGDETAISRYFDRNRERRGFEALADGMMALASGEGRVAMAKAARAEKFLARPELTNLLAAQAAEMAGDRAKAEEVYKRLLKDDRTRFVGVRGIMKQKLADGDTETALELAERAFALKPRHDETADILLQLQSDKGDWTGARRTLGAKLRSGALPRDVHRRRDAVLALSESEKSDDGDAGALDANRMSPDLVPAAAAAARALINEGRARQATKVIRKAWEAQPHPDLAAAFAEIDTEESPQARQTRFKQLLKLHPDHEETRLLEAELAIAAEDFEAARGAIGDLTETHPTARSLALMAAIERGSGAEDGVVRAYLARAVNAPRGPAWVCDNCRAPSPAWAPVCASCKSLDTLSWREVEGEPMPATAADLLPLLPEEPTESEEEPPVTPLPPDLDSAIEVEDEPQP